MSVRHFPRPSTSLHQKLQFETEYFSCSAALRESCTHAQSREYQQQGQLYEELSRSPATEWKQTKAKQISTRRDFNGWSFKIKLKKKDNK